MLIFDVNWNSVDDLYRAPGYFPMRILFQLSEYRNAKRLHWNTGTKTLVLSDGTRIFRVRQLFPPGWFISFGFVVMPVFARRVCALSKQYLNESHPQVAVFVSPHYLPLQRNLSPRFTVYHPIDDYTEYWPKRARLTRRREAKMVEAANIIICAGNYLAKYLRGKYPHRENDVFHISNPVPNDFVAQTPLPQIRDQKGVASPIIGYAGTLNERFNMDALVELSRALPEAEIRLYSPDRATSLRRKRLENVSLYPPVKRREVADLLRNFDVCILPQYNSHFIRCGSPRKLYEYLGSSRPVVALHTPEADTLRPFVCSTYSVEEFVRCVVSIIRDGEPPENASKRLQLAKERTPEALSQSYMEILLSRGAWSLGQVQKTLSV